MKSRKLLSLALSGAMALSLAVPAFAVDPTEDEANTGNLTTAISGSYKETEIDVAVPKTGQVFVNPYGLAATAEKTDGTKVPLAGEVMSAPLSIRNRSTSYLSIGAEASVVIPDTSGIKLATEPLDPEATGKSIYAQLEVVQAPASVAGLEAAVKDPMIDAIADSATWAKSGKVVLNSRGAATGENLAVLKPASIANDGTVTYAPGSIALFRISGDCAGVSARDPWADTDTFTVNVVFNFAPHQPAKYAITVNEFTTATQYDLPTVTTDVAQAMEGDTVTIKAVRGATADNLAITVKDAENNTVATLANSDGTADTNDGTGKTLLFTFTMPASAVTIDGVLS